MVRGLSAIGHGNKILIIWKRSHRVVILGEAKPGVSKPRGFPTFFGLCRGPFWDCSSQVLLKGRERGTGQIGNIPPKSGKSQKGQTRKDKSGQTSPDREAHHPFEPPPVWQPLMITQSYLHQQESSNSKSESFGNLL